MGVKSKIIHILKHTRFDKGVTDEDIADGIVMIKGGMMDVWLPEQLKTIRMLEKVTTFVMNFPEMDDTLPTLLELLYEQAQQIVLENCVKEDE